MAIGLWAGVALWLGLSCVVAGCCFYVALKSGAKSVLD